MSSVSPLPGIIRSPASHTLDRAAEPTRLRRWAAGLLAHEDSDLPGRIAIGASFLAAAYSLGDLVSESSLLAAFPYQLTRALLFGVTLLSGCIIAGGFLSVSRTARYTAIVATTTIAAYSLAIQLGFSGEALGMLKAAYGVALLGGVVVWALRGLRRWITGTVPSSDTSGG